MWWWWREWSVTSAASHSEHWRHRRAPIAVHTWGHSSHSVSTIPHILPFLVHGSLPVVLTALIRSLVTWSCRSLGAFTGCRRCTFRRTFHRRRCRWRNLHVIVKIHETRIVSELVSVEHGPHGTGVQLLGAGLKSLPVWHSSVESTPTLVVRHSLRGDHFKWRRRAAEYSRRST